MPGEFEVVFVRERWDDFSTLRLARWVELGNELSGA